MFALVVPDSHQSGLTAGKSFPRLLHHSQQDTEKWTAWCKQQSFVSAAAPPERFFQSILFNVAKSTRVHSKKADVLEQALLILHASILVWLESRVAGNQAACQVPPLEEADMQHLSGSHQAALLARFETDVALLTGTVATPANADSPPEMHSIVLCVSRNAKQHCMSLYQMGSCCLSSQQLMLGPKCTMLHRKVQTASKCMIYIVLMRITTGCCDVILLVAQVKMASWMKGGDACSVASRRGVLLSHLC